MDGPRVSVVIPNLDGGDMLLQAIRSATSPGVECIVVDNGSTDGSPESAERVSQEVRVVRAGVNLGFAEACDVGAATARGPYLLFLNNDAVLQDGALDTLLEEAERDASAAVWQPLIYSTEKEIESAGGLFTRAGFVWRLPEPAATHPYRVFAAVGPCILVRKQVFDVVGGFDPTMFAYSEDVDLSWRVRLHGCEVGVVPSARVFHHGGMTTSRVLRPHSTYYLGYRNRLRSLMTNTSIGTLLWILPLHLLASALIALGFLVNGRVRPGFAVLRAILWPLGHPTRIRKRRREVAKIRRIADSELWKPELVGRLTLRRASQLFAGNLRRW
jgi:hypothetical protein